MFIEPKLQHQEKGQHLILPEIPLLPKYPDIGLIQWEVSITVSLKYDYGQNVLSFELINELTAEGVLYKN